MSSPVITVQPTDQLVGVEQTATFSVTATSDHGALRYSWYKGREGDSSVFLAHGASYTTPSLKYRRGRSIKIDRPLRINIVTKRKLKEWQ